LLEISEFQSDNELDIDEELLSICLAHELGHNLGLLVHPPQGLMKAISLKEILDSKPVKLDISLTKNEISQIRKSLFLKAIS
jgi:alcohol dehydrogenase class IV